MNTIYKNIFPGLLALLMCIATVGKARAGIHLVNTNSDDVTTVGSFRNIISSLADGDTIKFNPSMANDTIKVSSALSITGSQKSITIIGDGVTLELNASSSTWNGFHKLTVEGVSFLYRGGRLTMDADSAFIRNCRVSLDRNVSSTYLNFNPGAGVSLFEGCAFITAPTVSGDNPQYPLYISGTGRTTFVSCTFFRPPYTGAKPTYLYAFHNPGSSSQSKTLINCVLVDGSMVSPGFTSSGGYNVLMGKDINITKAAGDTIMSQTATSPLVEVDGIYKVRFTNGEGLAYRLLPPQSMWEDAGLSGINFPDKDLAGNGIDYSCKTHAGAWQEVHLEFGETEPERVCTGTAPTGVTITAPTATIYTESGDYEFSSVVDPGDASQTVTWSSSNENIATIAPDGNSKARLTPVAPGTVTITATAAGTSVKAEVEVDVIAYIHVDHVEMPATLKFANYSNNVKVITAKVMPENALNKRLTWAVDDPNGYFDITSGNDKAIVKFRSGVSIPDVGTATVTVTSEDGATVASCEVQIHTTDYTDGVFMVVEGNYNTMPGSVHFLYPDGRWDELIIGGGVTGQFGTIYGENFYYVAKQNRDMYVINASTMKTDVHACISALSDGDPRSFVGVDNHTGYLSTSNGIYVFSLDFDGLYITPTGSITSSEGDATNGGQEGNPNSGLYTGQAGTMVRAGNYVFAIHQTKGLLVIDLATHQVVKTMTGYPFHGLALAHDGYLWSGANDRLTRLDPWTLEVTEITPILPSGYHWPRPTNWAAWRIESLHADPNTNALYWAHGGGSGAAFGAEYIYRYDIDANTVTRVLNMHDDFPGWVSYEATIGVRPTTGEVYVAAYRGNSLSDYKVIRFDPSDTNPANVIEYPMSEQLWFPSAFVFPDTAAPVINASFPTSVTLNETHCYDTLSLRPLVTDADNMSAAIVKTIEAIGNPTLVSALIRHDSLFITPLKDLTAPQTTTVSLKFNSNGKVVTQDLSVTVEPGAIAHPVTGITLNRATAAIAVGQTLQLAATVNPADADNKEMRWTSNLPYIASVDNNGLVTAHLAPATVTITATTVEGGFKAVCDITVEPPAVNNPFALNCTDTTIAVGDSVQLSITESEQYTKLVWHSLNEAVATVSDSGMVTAVAPGTAKIMVEDPESDRFNVCMITVPVPYYIHLDHTVLIMNEGDMVTVKATISPPDSTVNWSTGDGTVADVTDKGLVIAGVPGNAIIVAQLGNTQVYDTCKVTVRDIPFTVEVIEVGSDRATLKFPRVFSANCYPVYLYEGVSDSPVSVDTVKATAQSPNIFNFTQLKPDFFYEVAVAVISTVNGVDETVSTTTRVQFNTKVSTSIGGIDATNAAAWYSGGVLRLRNLKGYAGHVTSVTGQSLKVLRVNNDEETFAVSLSPGIYILTAQKEGDRKTFKFVVH